MSDEQNEHPIPEVIKSEKFQLNITAARISVERIQAAVAAQDQPEHAFAAAASIRFYKNAIELIDDRLRELNKKILESC
ncbi:MAG: hypothetical protein KAV87_17430 [Desulfobacteraceae bacterium]|nr:hypothetical protein [Desulfobacteraceae bacterium]